MNHTLPVSEGERRADAHRNLDGGVGLQPPTVPEDLVQRTTFDQLCHGIQVSVGLAVIEHAQDVRVLEARHDRFGQRPANRIGIGWL